MTQYIVLKKKSFTTVWVVINVSRENNGQRHAPGRSNDHEAFDTYEENWDFITQFTGKPRRQSSVLAVL